MSITKGTKVKSKAIMNAARGQRCTLALPCCNHDRDTVVAAHLPHESNGMGTKSSDLSLCFACSACHDATDSRSNDDITQGYIDAVGMEKIMRRAMVDTYAILFDLGVLEIKS